MVCKKDITSGFKYLFLLLFFVPEVALSADSTELFDFTRHWAGFLCLGIFFAAYSLVILEEQIHMFHHLSTVDQLILCNHLPLHIWKVN